MLQDQGAVSSKLVAIATAYVNVVRVRCKYQKNTV